MPPISSVLVIPEPFVPQGAFASIDILVTPHDPETTSGPFDAPGLHADERDFAASLSPAQRAGFVAGRQVLRAALQQVAPDHNAPVLRTPRGAPLLPPGLTGSVSHKRERAVAVAGRSTGDVVGVDLEERPQERDLARRSIAERILTRHELERLETLDALAHREATLVHFAIKEAVYKSIDPYVERYVQFKEVELDVAEDGSAAVRLRLPEALVQAVIVDAHWRLEGRWIIAMARSFRP